MDYNRIANRVYEMLKKYGQDATLRQYSVGGGEYDPSTQQTSVQGTTGSSDSIRKALITDQPSKRIGPQYGTNFKPSTLIQDGEKWVYIDARGPAPKPSDHMILNGVEYSIADVQVTEPGGVPLFYLIVCRI